VYKHIARVNVDDIAFSSSLFSDKVDNTDGLIQLQMDAFGCMVQGLFYRAMRRISAVFAVMQCLSVCPSVRLSVCHVRGSRQNE